MVLNLGLHEKRVHVVTETVGEFGHYQLMQTCKVMTKKPTSLALTLASFFANLGDRIWRHGPGHKTDACMCTRDVYRTPVPLMCPSTNTNPRKNMN